MLLCTTNATIKKGCFGVELHCELDDYSIAEIEGLNIKSSDNHLGYYVGDNAPPEIYVSMEDEKDFNKMNIGQSFSM